MGLTRGNDWRISSKCDANSCVQVGWSVRVRDSRNPDWPELVSPLNSGLCSPRR